MENQQEQARDILNALRGGETEAVAPPTRPSLTGLTQDAAMKRVEEFERAQEKYVEYLLSKPAAHLTPDEQKTITAEIFRWNREGRQ